MEKWRSERRALCALERKTLRLALRTRTDTVYDEPLLFSFGKCRIDGTLAQAGGVQLYLLHCLLVPFMAECLLHLGGLWGLQPLEVPLMGGTAGRLYPYLAPPNGCSCFHGSYPRCRPGGPKFHCPFLSRSLLEKLNLIQWVRKRLLLW